MDVFSAALDSGFAFLRDAAIAAAHDLEVFDAASAAPSTRRMRALLSVLDALGIVDASGAVIGVPPPRPDVPREGWGRLADVIRTDCPLPIDPVHEHAYQRHLLAASAPAAAELVARLPAWLGREPRSLVDLGGGAGAYTAAFLNAYPHAHATLVDCAEVLALARDALARFGDRVSFVAGDAREVDVGDARDPRQGPSIAVGRHDVALLANVLHLHGPDTCAELCDAAARVGEMVVVKDLRPDTLQGRFFALGMAIYTDGGAVYAADEIRRCLPELALEHRLEVADEGFVLTAIERPTELVELGAAIAPGFARVLSRALAYERARELCAGRGLVMGPPASHPRALDAHAVDDARLDAGGDLNAAASGARRNNNVLTTLPTRDLGVRPGEPPTYTATATAQLLAHYTRSMPSRRAEQMALPIFRAPLDWTRLPRLSAAIDRLNAILVDAGVDPVSRAPTLADLYERTYYGGMMPLLYGDAHLQRTGDPHDVIDRYLVAPLVHELCHLGRERPPIDPPHLDECIGGWLGIHVHAAFREDDAIYGAPWLAQVGQAVARVFGIRAVVRAHAGIEPLPAWFTHAAEQLGWRDWTVRRSLHLLADTMDPLPWVELARSRGMPEHPAFDRIVVRDALRAMCLVGEPDGAGFRTHVEVPHEAIRIADGWMTTARRVTPAATPRYWVPLAGRHELRIDHVDEIEALVDRLVG